MNNIDTSKGDALQQMAAEQAERNGLPAGDPDVDGYRLVIRAVRAAAMPDLPHDFAARLALRAMPAADSVSLEDGLATLLVLAMALGGGGYFMPRLWPMLSSLPISLPHLSWHWIIAATLAISLAWAVDKFWDERHSDMPA